MTIEKLKRIMIRVRAANPGKDKCSHRDLRRAIMIECGTTRMTVHNNKHALTDLGWIRRSKNTIYFTGLDLTEDYL